MSIENIKTTTLQTEASLFTERKELCSSIRDMLYYLKVSGHHVSFNPGHISPYSKLHSLTQNSPLDSEQEAAPMRALKQKLDGLKSNFVAHLDLMVAAHRQVGALLSVYQHAKMVTRAFPAPPYIVSVETFRKMWDLVQPAS